MIPGWKIKRELVRVVTQIRNIPLRLIEPFKRKRYDRRRWDLVTLTEGAIPLKDKVCVFLLYQPKALPASVIETCDFLLSKGYSILLVANGGLKEDVIAALKPRVWTILQRPNFGYDFGGFQDGVKFLNREGIVPHHLVILNDSIWFPMHKDSRVLENLQASAFDVTGLLLHSPARNDTPSVIKAEEEHRRFKLRRRLAEHIESYLIAVRADVFSGQGFQGFWENYAPSSSKYLTIKKGEIGFSKAMSAAGLSVGALSRRADFVRLIRMQDSHFVRTTLKYAAYSDADLEAECNALLATTPDQAWLESAISHIVQTVERRRFNASFCWATEKFFATSFVKKNDGMLFKRSRAQFLRAMQDGALDVDSAAALGEVMALVDQDAFGTVSPEMERTA